MSLEDGPTATRFSRSLDADCIKQRILDLEHGRVGFYSVGLYPASLAYNCAMQQASVDILMLAPRPGRALLGAFPDAAREGMDADHVAVLEQRWPPTARLANGFQTP